MGTERNAEREETNAEQVVEWCEACGDKLLSVYLDDGLCPDCRKP